MKYIVSLFFLSFFAACISDFTPDVKGVSGILVVDGTITGGESTFKLSRSVGILDTMRSENWIADATLSVECNDGTLFPASYEGDGLYRVINGELHANKEYRLNFTLDGTQYLSTFLQPVQTAEIDSLSWQKKNKGYPVSIFVTTHDDSNSSPYYRWSFEENWEIYAELSATHAYFDGILKACDLQSPVNTYYCWGKDYSKTLLLESTKELSTNIVSNKKIAEFPCSDERFSHLYHIEVSQMQIREEAYKYFSMLRDEIERTGGLFSPVMTAGDNGNIYNQSDTSDPIIGYIEVTNVTKKGMYIETDHLLYEPEPVRCGLILARGDERDLPLPWANYPEWLYTKAYCVDCRTHYNASKNKPTWWPTEHL